MIIAEENAGKSDANVCLNSDNDESFNFFLNILSFLSLNLDMLMIYFKSSQDILQGVSKLDHLMKVSYFQRYKKGVVND